MSVNYAAGLSNYPHIDKGKCGLPEVYDSPDELQNKISQLVDMIKASKHLVIHSGAGISTAAGIPDFRGPKGVWTLEAKGEAPNVNIDFHDAVPTKTHMAILTLQQYGVVKYLISQNIDGLHLRSGYPRCQLSELHGNMFIEKCEKCLHEYYRRTPVKTMKQERTGNLCMERGKRGLTNCRGKLRDTILDWEDSLPVQDLLNAEIEAKKADLSLCLGTTLQIVPSGKLPLLTLKNNGKMVIVNLQKTKYDKKANLIIHAKVDDVMEGVMKGLGLKLVDYDEQFYLSQTIPFPDEKDYHVLRGERSVDSRYSSLNHQNEKPKKREEVYIKKEEYSLENKNDLSSTFETSELANENEIKDVEKSEIDLSCNSRSGTTISSVPTENIENSINSQVPAEERTAITPTQNLVEPINIGNKVDRKHFLQEDVESQVVLKKVKVGST